MESEKFVLSRIPSNFLFSRVYLLHHRETNDMVAMKMLDSRKSADADCNIRKEISIHKLLKHQNIIAFLGYRQHAHYHYLFLEYAIGGELFDRIGNSFLCNQIIETLNSLILRAGCWHESRGSSVFL